MISSQVPLNALRAFEAAARHLSFTKAGLELRVTQAAVSHQVKCLEEILGLRLFRRLPRGLALTDEGLALMPVLADSFGRIRATLDRFENGHFREVVTVGTVGTFATGWLLPRLQSFFQAHPHVDLRILHQQQPRRSRRRRPRLRHSLRRRVVARNRRDVSFHRAAGTGLRAGGRGRLRRPDDLDAKCCCAPIAPTSGRVGLRGRRGVPGRARRGVRFLGDDGGSGGSGRRRGAAAGPPVRARTAARAPDRPFAIEIAVGDYWLTSLKSKRRTAGMLAFRTWLVDSVAASESGAQ